MKCHASAKHAALLLAAAPLFTAHAADPLPVDIGTILQQVQPSQPFPAPPRGEGPAFNKEDNTPPPPERPAVSVDVASIKILGNTLVETDTLHGLVADAEGKRLTLDQLDEMATRISRYYRGRGHTFARAVVPAQVISSGVVRFLVIEARYGKVGIDNQTRVNDLLLQATAAPLQGGQPVEQALLDKSLLLMSDIPGVLVQATLRPGDGLGSSDLSIQVTPGQAVSGNLALDDYGNSFTGRGRLGGTVYFNNPLRRGDVLGVGGLSSGSGVNYGRVSYESLLNGQGTRGGAAYSMLNYKIGGSLQELGAHGSAETESLWGRHPLLRSQAANVYGQVQYDNLQLRERIDMAGMKTDRHLGSWTSSLSGDWRDTLMSGGINTWSLAWTRGRVGFDVTEAQLSDAASARTEGWFSKTNLNFSRLQRWGDRGSLYVSWAGQWANTNLDSSQKMSVGGPYSVRAYDVSALSGDAGYRGSIELRYDLGAAGGGRLQALAFWDGAYLKVNQRPWTAGANTATFSGAGIGLDWSGFNQWRARAYLASPLGTPPELVKAPDAMRMWTELAYRF
ncbi:hemolysin activation/secretion protein [Polaromonas sp. CF318]|uniref:ShlB/FhaC/HecB family hemolysin secretion/activation protein n=1 Tax=Polaromonas sp. CF318 TaxID=1144318 RepID=UPI000270F206|nr:ShlB/FhaC/HecB family hemolysin secretion/activation protein [Polaromonas sp. CF318]EJL85289.1 hemolysin activation/secretion protein [Polaromonas sp. CF318]